MQNGFVLKDVFKYEPRKIILKDYQEEWIEDNLEMIMDKYQEEFDCYQNNVDPSDYLDFDSVEEWAIEYYEKEIEESRLK